MRLVFITLISMSAIVGCTTDGDSRLARQYPVVLGKSGYSVHLSEDGKESSVALMSSQEGRTSLTISIKEGGSTILTTLERDGIIVMLFDRNGDGVPDEGIERDVKNGSLKKFAIETRRIER